MAGLRLLMLTAVGVGASACATITSGRYQTIEVTSTPPGAAVTVQCGLFPDRDVVTPATVRLSRRAQPCALTVASPGYQSRTVSLDRRVSRAFWGNLAWAPVLGLAGLLGSDDCSGGGFGICFSAERSGGVAFLVGLVPAAIGMGVDAATGAMYQKVPSSVDVTLPAARASAAPGANRCGATERP